MSTVSTTPTAATTTPTNSLGPITIAVSAGLLAANAFFIGLRCYSQAKIAKAFDFNDVFMIGAVLIYAGLFGVLIFAVRDGIGTHLANANVSDLGNALKFTFFLEIIYVLLTSLMKASLALTLLQWAKVKSHILVLKAALLIDALICIIVVEYFLVQCAPISYTWELTDPTKKGVCLPQTQQIAVGFALSGTTVSIDMLFLIAPWVMLKGRGVNPRLKMYIYGIFGAGVAASIANFIRLATLKKLADSKDPLFDAAPVFLWSAVEVSIGIQVAGIIELRPLMRRYGVKGFEDQFDQIDEDRQPIRLQSMDKTNISFPMPREVRNEQMQRQF